MIVVTRVPESVWILLRYLCGGVAEFGVRVIVPSISWRHGANSFEVRIRFLGWTMPYTFNATLSIQFSFDVGFLRYAAKQIGGVNRHTENVQFLR